MINSAPQSQFVLFHWGLLWADRPGSPVLHIWSCLSHWHSREGLSRLVGVLEALHLDTWGIVWSGESPNVRDLVAIAVSAGLRTR